ncbi:hypothetical protein NHX12_010171 [Muraenolepis orangiensis]|uniref:non-specific serine/threonine protein kinase n=1 Tax=Muraenolepis orangiensis TaxID=630683 RepID=A0A9Q0DJ80_9TELE|nr:hypothetical protein NHX12_010171 [Muraenolepis orangiensis]
MDIRVSDRGGKMVESDGVGGGGGGGGGAALQQCELIQNMIEISISSLQGLRTKCAASNDLTQQEIRTLEVRLMKYICKQLQFKQKVSASERPTALDSYPKLRDWLHTVNLRPELFKAVPVHLSLDDLLQMPGSQVREVMRRLGASAEECQRLTAALSCLKSATESGGELREDGVPWLSEPIRRDSGSLLTADQLCSTGGGGGLPPLRPHSPSPLARPATTPSTPSTPGGAWPPPHPRSGSVPADAPLFLPADPSFPVSRATARLQGRAATPPATPPSKRRQRPKPPCTPPPPSRRVLQLLPNISLTRSKSHESQLGHRIEEPNAAAAATAKSANKKNKLILNMQVNGNGYEEAPLRHPARTPGSTAPTPSARTPGSGSGTPGAPFTLPGTPTLMEDNSGHRGSPQTMRRDIGLAVTHRFSTKSWLSQTCQVCQKSMMFGVKCKHCRLKCHNKCTKEAPSCRITFHPIAKIRRTESVPSDINNPVDRPAEVPMFGTLPKALTKKEHPPGPRDGRFHFPDVSGPVSLHSELPADAVEAAAPGSDDIHNQLVEDEDEEEAEEDIEDGRRNGVSDGEGDELDDLPDSCRRQWRGPISRKASQTSVYLQEWDIPFEQLDLGELIGKGRWGKVYKGRWHGEVAIRLLQIDGNNQDHLKLFKKEVMNYRQTRHENVVLFMGACMAPPHLAIITSFCKGRTLYSVVRDSKSNLDINKTRQIAQEIVKGIVHKDLKSKNVFHDLNKVVITDFGLFGISGVVQEDRRENRLKLPHGWICYLAPEIVRRMSPGNNEDRLPFSAAADVYAFGTIWYELQARDWPITNQPVEATIWQVGSGEGIKKLLAEVSLGKEVTEILSACWAYDPRERPTFTQLADMLEKLPKLNRRLSHPGHFWKSAEYALINRE